MEDRVSLGVRTFIGHPSKGQFVRGQRSGGETRSCRMYGQCTMSRVSVSEKSPAFGQRARLLTGIHNLLSASFWIPLQRKKFVGKRRDPLFDPMPT